MKLKEEKIADLEQKYVQFKSLSVCWTIDIMSGYEKY